MDSIGISRFIIAMIYKLRLGFRFLQAYIVISRIQRTLQKTKFTGAKKCYLRAWKPQSRDLEAEHRLVREIAWAVTWACRWQRHRADCLPRSLSGYHLLCQAGARPEFVMAVQSRPFASHAWIEVAGQPIFEEDAGSKERYHEIMRVLNGETIGHRPVSTPVK